MVDVEAPAGPWREDAAGRSGSFFAKWFRSGGGSFMETLTV
jgi:hypothetical protein